MAESALTSALQITLATVLALGLVAGAERTQHLELRVVPAPGPVAIDGALEDWDTSGAILLCNDLAAGTDRRSARASAMYDAEALYLGLAVRDATPLRNPTPRDRATVGWRGDCLQMRLRLPRTEGADRILFLDAWRTHPGGDRAAWLQFPGTDRAPVDLLAGDGALAFTRSADGGGYVQELRIPWDALGLADRVAPGLAFGLGLEVVGGAHGDPDAAFRLANPVARHGTDTAGFFAHPERWGRARLTATGELEPAEYLTMPVDIAEHPFLICRRADFPELRRRAEREPWRGMAADARARVAAGLPDGEGKRHAIALQYYLGACALTYILEPESASDHAERVRAAIVDGLGTLAFEPEKNHKGTVPPMGAAFLAILALDVVHDDLDPAAVAACEAVIAERIARIDRQGGWPAARLGTHGTWDIYRGERLLPDDVYLANFEHQMTADGVTTVSPDYAFARLGSGSDRPQKSGYADVLEYTGIDRRYYRNPRLQAFYRWLFSHSVTPSRAYHLFGDVGPNWSFPNAPLLWRVGRFDQRAARHAAWLLADRQPPGHVLSYVLMREPLGEPLVPRSRLYAEGGAFLREERDDPLALGAALYSIVGASMWHTHEETNAISLTAYGNRLLVNGGWLGDDMRPPWKNNTIAIDRERHAARTGGGLHAGLLAPGFDYACGDAGGALGGAGFRRSLVLVHSRDDTPGYMFTHDTVTAHPGARVHHYLHPATESAIAERSPGRAYRAQIDHHAERDGVALDVVYASEPDTVTQARVESGLLERTPSAGHHRRLEALFTADADGRASVLTLFLPSDPAHAAPSVAHLDLAPTVDAVRIVHAADRHDLLFAAAPEATIDHDGVRAQAASVWLRRHPEAAERAWFARAGRMLRSAGRGFTSDRPVTLFVRATAGRIAPHAEAVTLTLHHPGITTLAVDGEPLAPQASGPGWLRVVLPASDAAADLAIGVD